jgi:PhoPQ-activated pathogenicity-related protein
MLKYDEVLKLLNTTKEITLCINNYLLDTANDNFADIISLYSSRLGTLEQLRDFFESKSINRFTQREKEFINDLVQEIIFTDNQNIVFLDKRVKDTKISLKKIQSQKSVLIYSKSST